MSRASTAVPWGSPVSSAITIPHGCAHRPLQAASPPGAVGRRSYSVMQVCHDSNCRDRFFIRHGTRLLCKIAGDPMRPTSLRQSGTANSSLTCGLAPSPSRNRDVSRLVAPVMKDSVMGAADRDHELIADPAPQCLRLGKSQVMRIRRPTSTQQAGLRRYELQVSMIAVAARLAQREGAFVDMPSDGVVHSLIGFKVSSRGFDIIFCSENRRRRQRPPATPFPGDVCCQRVGTFTLGRLRGGSQGRERHVCCSRWIRRRPPRRCRNGRVVIAVPKSRYLRREFSLHEAGIRRGERILWAICRATIKVRQQRQSG
jgi:hypothetical protein